MKQPTYQQIMEIATQLKNNQPMISNHALLTQFVRDKVALQYLGAGIIANPISDHWNLLQIIFHSLRKLITQDRAKLMAIQDKIDKAILELTICK
jgi:hypothetical protein